MIKEENNIGKIGVVVIVSLGMGAILYIFWPIFILGLMLVAAYIAAQKVGLLKKEHHGLEDSPRR